MSTACGTSGASSHGSVWVAPNTPALGFAKYTTSGELIWRKEKPVESGRYPNAKVKYNWLI